MIPKGVPSFIFKNMKYTLKHVSTIIGLKQDFECHCFATWFKQYWTKLHLKDICNHKDHIST